ncbi:MAG: VCBS repeat-containing protein [Chitinophagaceae bacterium]|nr:VCBS repeat-containing protein [Chitinophagaceae bacterium]
MIYKRFSIKILVVCIIIPGLVWTSCTGKKGSSSLFETIPSSRSNITFSNKPVKKKLFSILYYLYYYNGGGVATGDINNDGLPDIYFTANDRGQNKLYLNKGNFEFEDITDKAGVAGSSDWCSGVTMADVNSDGRLDIYVSVVSGVFNLKGENELFINNGDGTFTNKAKEYGLNFHGLSTQAAFFDFDKDGDLDCYLLRHSKRPHENITDTSNRSKYDSLAGDMLLKNERVNGQVKFTDVSKQAGIYQSLLGYGLGLAVADFNNDGWEDVYVGNDFHENDYYYLNQKNGTFKEEGVQHFNHYSRFSMGNDAADYNNDGQMDIITVDMLPPDEKTLKTYGSDENPDIYKVKLELQGYQHQYSKNCLQRNNNHGSSYSEVGLMNGVSATDWSWSPLFADFDNDGNKDLFITSGIVKRPVDLDYIRFVSDVQIKKGLNATDAYDEETINAMPDGASHPFVFKGHSNAAFSNESDAWGLGELSGYFNGAAYADFDNDGKPDLVVNSLNGTSFVLKNNSPKKNFLSLSFKGDSLNTYGIGAKAYLFTDKGIQYQQLMLTRGFQSSSDPRLHFGLDSTATIDSILIVWPDQRYELLKNVPTNQFLKVSQTKAGDGFLYENFFPQQRQMFRDITAEVQCNWTHRENDFLDFNVQYLIPHEESTRGPKIAVGDVNGDGLDDFYVCGAKGQAGALMIQQPNGTFISTNNALFEQFKDAEDVDAVFFDANEDKFPDLLVIAGGNEVLEGSVQGLDRLYINDGKGNFKHLPNTFPNQFDSKSCVAVADINKDGLNDFFVGNLASQTAYGLPVTSYFYLNQGQGNFLLADRNTIYLQKTGMVTSACFADVNNDTWPDLIITGEWMPVKILMNDKGHFTETEIPNSTGLWQCLYPTDINGDGLMDLLAGNWGHNSKLWAGKTGPLKLYVKDFDNNNSIDQVMVYTIDGKEYTFLAKDELERQLPVLKKAYLTYKEVAGKTVQYMFYDLFKDYTELKAEVLSSSCFINDGKGGFTRYDLPEELQSAPVFCFSSSFFNQEPTYLAAGNFYGVIPYEGRYDALPPTFFSFNRSKKDFKIEGCLSKPDGETRDAKWIRYSKGEKIMVVARNNKELLFYKPVK